MIEFLKAILLGIVEGITEWLPISSTGHMILLDEFIKLNVSPSFKEMFLVVIQLGAILAVVVLYWGDMWPFGTRKGGIVIKKDIFQMWFKVLVAMVPTIVVGAPLKIKLGDSLDNYKTVSIMLIIFGVLFLLVERYNQGIPPKITSIAQLDYRTALTIGAFQLIAALFPGTSRSGATIVGALLLGVSRVVAAEFTFFLAVPTMVGASLFSLIKFGFSMTGHEAALLIVGMITAFVVSILAIKFMMSYIKNNDFRVFGWYRIILGIIVLGYFRFFS